MHFANDKVGAVLFLQLQGQINSANAAALEACMVDHFDRGERKIVLDLSQLDYVSSAGLRVILLLAKKLKADNGVVALCDIQPRVREVLEISGFLAILTIFASRTEAQAALS